MKKEVLVEIRYVGFFKNITKKIFEQISVPLNIDSALNKIYKYINETYKIDKNYSVLINSQTVPLFSRNDRLDESTVFTIIPIISGG